MNDGTVIAISRAMPASADVLAIVTRNAAWLTTAEVSKLLLTFDGVGLSNAPAVVDWARGLPGVEIQALGAAGHHAPEDAPDEIAAAIRGWLDRLYHRG